MNFKLLTLLIAAIAMLSFTTPIEESTTPEETIAKFQEALLAFSKDGEISLFDGLASDKMKEIFALTKEFPKQDPVKKIKEVTCKTEGELSHCDCTTEDGNRDNLLLEKQGENWIVVGLKGKRVTDEDIALVKGMIEQFKKMDQGNK